MRAILRIASHPDAGSDKGGGIESQRRDQVREAINAVAKLRCSEDDLLAGRIGGRDNLRRQMIGLRFRPALPDHIRFDAKDRRIDRARATERAQYDGRIENSTPLVRELLEPEGAALGFGKAAELQSYERD